MFSEVRKPNQRQSTLASQRATVGIGDRLSICYATGRDWTTLLLAYIKK
jgi:hypothetical protein